MLGSDPVGSLTGSALSRLADPSGPARHSSRASASRGGRFLRRPWWFARGYGIYHDTSVYQSIALQMAQQAPLSKSLSVQNSAACPLTLANGFKPCSTTSNTFASIRTFASAMRRPGSCRVQRDLPGALQMTATYLGIKGTHGVQEFLPNTYPHRRSESLSRLSDRDSSIAPRTATRRGKRARFSCGAGCAAASPRSLAVHLFEVDRR